MSQAEQFLQDALNAFDFGGQVVGAVRYGSGHINDTFCVHTQPGEDPCRRFILQRISSAAFHHPEQVMANIVGVTSYLGKVIAEAGGDPTRETMCVYATKDGKNFYTDPEGGAWRVYPFIEDTKCLQSAETPELFAASALAFGRFQQMLKDYPADTLYETIPRFHDTEDRLAKLKAAVAADAMGRVKDVQAELDFVTAREADCSVALQALRDGKLPLRVTHNDTKINNVLFQPNGNQAIVVIDLDTVMPGLVGHDFGDAIRFAANYVEEDSPEAEKAGVDMEVFRAFTQGFLKHTAATLTQQEVDTLALSCFALTCELATRFLDDYILGSPYFKIQYPEHNLVRARCQIALAKDMLQKLDEMDAVVHQCMEQYR